MTLNGLPTVLRHENVWMDAPVYNDAERQYQEFLARGRKGESQSNKVKQVTDASDGKTFSSIATDIANAREKIKNMLSGDSSTAETISFPFLERLQNLEKETSKLNGIINDMSVKLQTLQGMIGKLMPEDNISKVKKPDLPATQNGSADDDDIDLFGSDEETEDDARIREERLKAYESKKAKKPALVAKSSVVLDVKPWDDETDMKQLETAVKSITTDGLKWGASKLVPLAYGIKKLQIVAIVEDDKVSIDWLQEAIQENEDLVQSVDIAAFNKL